MSTTFRKRIPESMHDLLCPMQRTHSGRIYELIESLHRPALSANVPAILAEQVYPEAVARYGLISTRAVGHALAEVRFFSVEARQAASRKNLPVYARHLIRFHRECEPVQLPIVGRSSAW